MQVRGELERKNVARMLGPKPAPHFGHGVEATLPSGVAILCSFHPSQQNTFTGKLTEAMFDAIFARARELLGAQGEMTLASSCLAFSIIGIPTRGSSSQKPVPLGPHCV